MVSAPRRVTPDEARDRLVGQLGLRAMRASAGAEGAREVLAALRLIQLDPLDRVGTNADLVAMARVDGLKRGGIYDALMPGHAFEHFAKERCLVPAEGFPYYRALAARRPWLRLHSRYEAIPEAAIEAVYADVAERGPLTAGDLDDHGRAAPLDLSGWKTTTKVGTMALRVLWARCRVVVSGRRGRDKLYDLPERALGAVAEAAAPVEFARWALLERVEAAGLLSVNAGPQWSMLSETRTGALVGELVSQGLLERVQVGENARIYLAPRGFLDRRFGDDDGQMRILGPLDPLLWDRKLVEHAFGFEYIWEVYKPAAQRRWGYYVCPLLHHGRLVGRFEGHVEAGELVVDRLWREEGAAFDERAWQACRERHASQLEI
ncbi:MAG: crosslink repair DNA glycosylase YcaQ family protein [Myxococcota bacterium]